MIMWINIDIVDYILSYSRVTHFNKKMLTGNKMKDEEKVMSESKCSRELYCKFLEVTSIRYSALSLSEAALESMSLSHDSVIRWLSSAQVQSKDLWEVVEKEIEGKCGILTFDDVVADKSRS
jgi:hypothetical protein